MEEGARSKFRALATDVKPILKKWFDFKEALPGYGNDQFDINTLLRKKSFRDIIAERIEAKQKQSDLETEIERIKQDHSKEIVRLNGIISVLEGANVELVGKLGESEADHANRRIDLNVLTSENRRLRETNTDLTRDKLELLKKGSNRAIFWVVIVGAAGVVSTIVAAFIAAAYG